MIRSVNPFIATGCFVLNLKTDILPNRYMPSFVMSADTREEFGLSFHPHLCPMNQMINLNKIDWHSVPLAVNLGTTGISY